MDKDHLSRFLFRMFFALVVWSIRKCYRWLFLRSLDKNPKMGANIYTKKKFALELKKRVKQGQSQERIGDWVYAVFNDCVYYYQKKDQDFLNILHDIRCMEIEKEYEIYCKKLNEIADKLI